MLKPPLMLALLIAVAAAIAVLIWQGLLIANPAVAARVQFRQQSGHGFDHVTRCLKQGNGREIFADFDYLWVRDRDPFRSTYLGPQGARLDVQAAAIGTIVTFRSWRAPTPEQADLLEWCVKNPRTTWIPAEFRSPKP